MLEDLSTVVEKSRCGSSMVDTKTSFKVPQERTVAHDFTFGHWSAALDHPLSSIFGTFDSATDVLTPDAYKIISEKELIIEEYATCGASARKTLEAAFNSKKFKYIDAISERCKSGKIQADFYVTVVNFQSVLSNRVLSQDEVEELCMRYRTAHKIKCCLLDHGVKMFDEDEAQKDISETRAIFSNIDIDWDKLAKDTDNHFSKELYTSWHQPLDAEWVSETIKKELTESWSEAFHRTNKEARLSEAKTRVEAYMTEASKGPRRNPLQMSSVVKMPLVDVKLSTKTTSFIDSTTGMRPAPPSVTATPASKLWRKALIDVMGSELDPTLNEDISKELLRVETEETMTDRPFEETEYSHKSKYRRVVVQNDDAELQVELAKLGVNGKVLRDDEAVKEHRKATKTPFSIEHNVQDIGEFINDYSEWFEECNYMMDHEAMRSVLSLIIKGLNMAGGAAHDQVMKASFKITRMKGFRWAYFLSSIAQELTLSMKQNCKKDEYIMKRLKDFNAFLLIKPTRSQSHIFWSLLIPKGEVNDINQSTVFRTMEDCGNCYVTEFSSMSKSKLVNWIKAEASFVSLVATFSELYKQPLWEDEPLSPNIKRHVNASMLILLSDKHQVEEVVTMSRYVFMEGFVSKPILPRPDKMITKMSVKPRSRLEVYFLKRLITSIEKINSQRGFQMGREGNEVTWSGLFDLISGNPVPNVYVLINLFYLGYLKNKEQSPEKNVSGKLLTKILEYEDILPEVSQHLGLEDPVVEALKKHLKCMIKEGLESRMLNEGKPDQVGEKVEDMSRQMESLREEVRGLREKNERVGSENDVLKKKMQEIMEENEKLKDRLKATEDATKQQDENLVEVQKKQEHWVKEQGNQIDDFKEIMRQQEKEQKMKMKKEVVQVLKEKEDVVRGIVEKKQCVVAFGVKQKEHSTKVERKREEMEIAKKIVGHVEDEAVEDIEDVYRLGQYKEGKLRPLKIKFRSQQAASKVIQRAWKLSGSEEYGKVWIREDLSEDERAKRGELYQESKEKNGQRTEEEKANFYWRVLDGRLRKWFKAKMISEVKVC